MEFDPPMKHVHIKPVQFWDEFKRFAFKGNLLDLAVAVVIGNAFSAVVTSLVKNILMPIISYVLPNSGTYREWHIGKVEIGAFLGELLNFTIVSLAMFVVVVKLFGTMQRLLSPQGADSTTKECPYCASVISNKAIRCPQCTSDLAEVRDPNRDHEPISAKSS
jgi:large conductance mechanosensitive channel